MSPDANTTWFNFSAESGDFGVYGFVGREEVSHTYEFSIELVSRDANVDVNSLLGTAACLSIADRSGGTRLAHGIIREMEQLHTGNAFTHYRCSIVPRLWFLGQIRDFRIFQDLTIVEIIQKIIKEQGFSEDASSFNLSYTYEPREYCVQYGETTLHFISRICEEEGIYFYFEHSENYHKLCFCDREGGPTIEGESDIRFFAGSGQVADTAVINRLAFHQGVNSNASSYKEWNFTSPKLALFAKEYEQDTKKAPVPSGMYLEQYTFPHLYQSQKNGERYAKLQLGRQLTFSQWIECESDVSRYLPSYTFTIQNHPRNDVNAAWWVSTVYHNGEQPGVLEHEAPSGRSLYYNSHVTAIPSKTRFIPEVVHTKNHVIGPQTAIVTGPKGEEIYPDKYGRVKVQFFWDREGKWDDKTTCWIRVSQGWAGSSYGTMAIPRIGHEVIVTFLAGNPDRPLITGRVYHELNMPPYQLPDNKTRTVFKSMSTPGKEGEERGFNELRIEDKKGGEEIYVHAEKDVNVYVKNDWKEHILHDKHETVDHFRYTHIKEEEHLLIEKPRKQELKEEDHLTVHKDSHAEYKTKMLAKAGDEIHLKADMKVVIEAGTDLTIKAGGQWIRLDPSGIKTSPQFFIGAGSPGSGSGANPALPKASIVVGVVAGMKAAQQAAQPLCSTCNQGGAS